MTSCAIMSASEMARTRASLFAGTSRAAPITGSHSSRLRRPASDMLPAPPERTDESRKREEQVELEVAGLHAPKHGGAAPREARHPVQRPVEQQAVADAKEYILRDPLERSGEHQVVRLVDKVLRRQQAVQG